MHQDHVTGRRSVLDDLQRYPIDLCDTFVKPRYPRSRISSGAQFPEVRVPFERLPELRTSSLRRRWFLGKPTMHKTMGSA
jgi:hypothetical protein